MYSVKSKGVFGNRFIVQLLYDNSFMFCKMRSPYFFVCSLLANVVIHFSLIYFNPQLKKLHEESKQTIKKLEAEVSLKTKNDEQAQSSSLCVTKNSQ